MTTGVKKIILLCLISLVLISCYPTGPGENDALNNRVGGVRHELIKWKLISKEYISTTPASAWFAILAGGYRGASSQTIQDVRVNMAVKLAIDGSIVIIGVPYSKIRLREDTHAYLYLMAAKGGEVGGPVPLRELLELIPYEYVLPLPLKDIDEYLEVVLAQCANIS